MIPRVLFLYWGGRRLSWLRYLTVVSFKKHNPDWEIRVFRPTHPTIGTRWTTDEQRVKYEGKDWLEELPTEPIDMKDLGFDNDMAEVHKSDIFRLWALREYGGVYSDFDILYTKSLPEVKERWFCFHPDGHYAVGLLAAKQGDDTCNWLLESVKLRTDRDKYQSFGSSLWGAMLDGAIPAGRNIPKNLVYSVDWQDAEELFTENKKLPKEAVGIHWYGGSVAAGHWENLITPETYQGYGSTITNIIKGLL